MVWWPRRHRADEEDDGMNSLIVVLWAVWASATQPLDARPVSQFDTIEECLSFIDWQQQQPKFQENEALLRRLGTSTTLLCLPAGVHP